MDPVRRKPPAPSSATGQTGAVDPGLPATGQITVRPAVEDDLDALLDQTWAVAAEGLWIGVEVPFDREARRIRLASMIEGVSSTVLVADGAVDGGPGPVGHIAVTIAPYGVADIGMLIAEGWRGQGIGRMLLGAAIGWAAASGAHKMALEVWPHNRAALGLYHAAGFVEEGRKRRHYRRRNGELWDSVLMGRPLP
jgi:RimJ/RimL family protein N-acetyltransferase